MKKLTLTLIILSSFFGLAYAGGPPDKEVTPPCPQWYADNEWNINLALAYAFTGTEFAPNPSLIDLIQSSSEGHTVYGTFDHYLADDHAWGGSVDVKYFFARYFGVGIQGSGFNGRFSGFDIESRPLDDFLFLQKNTTQRFVGSVLGTFTLRYPVPCSRFAPYAWGGIGAIFGGGESDHVITSEIPGVVPPEQEEGDVPFVNATTVHSGTKTELMGQFGGGLEIRFTRHVGWTNDISWNVISGARNDFGMIRTGINFAF